MTNEHDNTGIDPQARDDYTAVMRHVAEGTPVEPELARRVRERAERITDEIRREHGDIDVVQLLHDARDDT
jgi:truncated hemoglobin YjbI